MKLFDPARPEASPGRKALLLDGAAVPNLVLTFQPPRLIRVSAMLRNHADASANSFSWREAVMSPEHLPALASDYILDPEDVLFRVFGWTARPPSAPAQRSIPREAFRAEALSDNGLDPSDAL